MDELENNNNELSNAPEISFKDSPEYMFQSIKPIPFDGDQANWLVWSQTLLTSSMIKKYHHLLIDGTYLLLIQNSNNKYTELNIE